MRALCAQVLWLIHSRIDVCVAASKLAQVTEKSFNITHVKQYNTAVRYLQDTRHLYLRMYKLDHESLHIRAYADASFFTNSEDSSQLSCMAFLADKQDNYCVLHYDRYKSHRVARYVVCAES